MNNNISGSKNIKSSDSPLKYDDTEYPEECPSSTDIFSDESLIDETSNPGCSINNSILSPRLTTKVPSNDSIGQNISPISIKFNESSTSMLKKETVNNDEAIDASNLSIENKTGNDEINKIHESDKEKLEESIAINDKTPQRNLANDYQANDIDEYSDILEKVYGSNVKDELIKNLETPQRNLATVDPVNDIDEYSDLLEKLYGSNVKDKLIKNIKTDEKKKIPVDNKKRLTQTEPTKKNTRRGKIEYLTSSSSSQDDDDIDDDHDEDDDDDDNDDDLINKKTRHYLNITPTESKKKKITFDGFEDSFINDSSESEGEEIDYLPITPISIRPGKRLPKKTPISELTRKAKAICDSDTEDEDYRDKKNTARGSVHNKRLSFSDDTLSNEEIKEKTPKYIKNISKKTPKKINHLKASDKPVKIKSFLASLSDSVPIERCHPDVKKYKGNFKNTKEELTKKLYDYFNENVFDNCLPEDTALEWNPRLLTTGGRCKYRSKNIDGKIINFCIIESSPKVVDNAERLANVLIHEMCHAATFLIDNKRNEGHGVFWKRWGRKANGIFPELAPIKTCHQYKIFKRYLYRCVGCGQSFGRHSKSVDTNRFVCGICKGKFELLINKVNKNGVELKKSQKRAPSAFALYVKDNYAKIKQQNTGVPHKDVMKILGQMYTNLKTNDADLEKISQQITAINIDDTSNKVVDVDTLTSSNKN